jgi:hypothetical protein
VQELQSQVFAIVRDRPNLSGREISDRVSSCPSMHDRLLVQIALDKFVNLGIMRFVNAGYLFADRNVRIR